MTMTTLSFVKAVMVIVSSHGLIKQLQNQQKSYKFTIKNFTP